MSKMIQIASILAAVSLLVAPACGSDPGGSDSSDAGNPNDPDAFVPTGPFANIVINEFMAKNRFTLEGPEGQRADWLELYNPTDEDVDLGGWSMTDDLQQPGMSILRPGTIVPAGGYLILHADDEQLAGPEHLGFKISKSGGALALVAPDGEVKDQLSYGPQTTDLSAARTPDGSDQWQVTFDVSPGTSNPAGEGQAVNDLTVLEEVPAAGDVSEQLLFEEVLSEFDLEIPQASIESLRAEPRVYVEAALTYKGRRFDPIGIRLKGQNSFLPIDEKPSFRIEMDHFVDGAELLGLDDLTLNNMRSDPSMMHERFAYKVSRLAGIASPRASYAFITVNDQAYGLYAHIEHVEPRFLARWYDDPTGPLYEAGDVDFTDELIPNYEHESGPDDRTQLYALADALTLPTKSEQINAATMVDREQFIRHWGAMAIIGQFDAFPYTYDDYYVYVNPEDDKLNILPWGMDESYTRLDYWLLAGESLLPDACQKDTPCVTEVIDDIWRVLDTSEAEDILTEFDAVQAQIAPYIAQDPRRPWTDLEVEAAQNDMRLFIEGRRGYVDAEMPDPTYYMPEE